MNPPLLILQTSGTTHECPYCKASVAQGTFDVENMANGRRGSVEAVVHAEPHCQHFQVMTAEQFKRVLMGKAVVPIAWSHDLGKAN